MDAFNLDTKGTKITKPTFGKQRYRNRSGRLVSLVSN
jgi:hypothetical protein